MTQHLLQGFGFAVNSRQIHIARNQREISDLVFKQQVITTVAAVMNLYWDLVAFNEDVRVKQQALATSEKLYNDNKKQVEVGTLAPIDIVRAEAEVASRQQDLTDFRNPGAAAGDHPQKCTQQERRGQPLGCRRAASCPRTTCKCRPWSPFSRSRT